MLWALGLLPVACFPSVSAAPKVSLLLAQSYTTTTGTARTNTSLAAAGATGAVTAINTSNVGVQANCAAIDGVFNESCWGVLGLTDYLTHWNQTVKRCNPLNGDDGADCCEVDEAWTTCFLRLGHGASVSLDCTSITGDGCIYNADMNVDVSIRPQVHYMMKTIYCE